MKNRYDSKAKYRREAPCIGSINPQILWSAAREGKLNKIAAKFLTEENLRKKDHYGWNAFHYAAAYGNLKQMPKKFLTEKNLSIEDDGGWTCIHVAADEDTLETMPKEFLTPKNLLKKPKIDKKRDTKTYSALELYLKRAKKPSNLLRTIKGREWTLRLKDLEKVKTEIMSKERREVWEAIVEEIRSLKKLREMPSLKI